MSGRIFVVEDDALLRDAVDLILSDAGYAVGFTGAGRGAVEVIAAFRPDLVLLDIRLPDVSGLDVLTALRKAGHRYPVVMMTADSRPETVRDVMALGGDGYLVKPLEAADLVSRVQRALRAVRR
ncbi:hypothetical protein BH09PSE1_BH09PSE1_09600 [soil metagenome]